MVTRLSSAHANTTPTDPLTLFGQAVAVRGDLAMVGVPEFETVDANGNPVSGGIVEMYEGNASGTQWTRTGSFLPPYPATDGSFGVPRQPSRDQATLSTRQGTHVPCAGSKPITTCGTHKTSFYTSNRSLSSICRTQSTTHWSRSFGGPRTSRSRRARATLPPRPRSTSRMTRRPRRPDHERVSTSAVRLRYGYGRPPVAYVSRT